jgi:hypothetical protein
MNGATTTTTTAAKGNGKASSGEAFPPAKVIAERVDRLVTLDRSRYHRLWGYFRNPMRAVPGTTADSDRDRPYRQAQEWGLPARITGARPGCEALSCDAVVASIRKEVVIENDIGWRIETMVDYLFGRPLVIESAAPSPDRRAVIGALLRQILAGNGGILLLQQLALVGSVYGFADVLVKFDPSDGDQAGTSTACGTHDLGEPPAGQKRSHDQNEDDDGMHRADLPDGTGPSDTGAGGSAGASSPPGAAPRADDSPSPADLDTASPTRAASDDSHAAPPPPTAVAAVARLARMVRLEVVEPARALPFLCPTDYRRIEAYGQLIEATTSPGEWRDDAGASRRTWVDLLRRLTSPRRLNAGVASPTDDRYVVEVITPTRWRRYENGRVVAEGANSLGQVPVVHVQNTAIPFAYGGASDVEPLIPLQDELNTRLSDRANRITLQSFKMYLGKNIENFTSLPVAPGRMWASDSSDADVIEFGGDASCPSEESHISDMREAMDKTSGVTPIAAGAIKGRIGNLTSAAALRVTLQALLAKTEKKRTTYGAAIQQLCELSLAWLDRAGLFPTTPDERRVELNWPSPIPENESEKLQEAEAKLRLGVPREVVLRELGY